MTVRSASGPEAALQALRDAVAADDQEARDLAVAGLRSTLATADVGAATTAAVEALSLLRGVRQFPAMLHVAEAAFHAGIESATALRLYAQALIEEGLLTAALNTLAPLRRHPGPEAAEIDGLIGRAHKQRYVESPRSAGAEHHLRQAIDAYLTRYLATPAKNLWHGINAVAMLARAERDGRSTGGDPDWRALADQLVATVSSKAPDGRSPWDAAIAAEAYVALELFEAAAGWLAAYTGGAAGAQAFEFASTLRQLRQVWQIEEDDPRQRALVDLLEARLLRAEGGRLHVDATQRARELDNNAQYLEGVFGADEYQTIQWYRAGLEAAKSVVRIVRRYGTTVGTGFVVPGDALRPSWAGSLVVVTNFHVVNRNAVHPGHSPGSVGVVFEDNGVEVPIEEVLWESPHAALGSNPPASLDTAVLRLAPPAPPAPCYQPSRAPTPGIDERVYVIGYPLGQQLAFSLHDNKVVGSSDAVIHYRAPTRPGSSGSPVFDAQWGVVGLHHGGAPTLASLRDRDATYAANEGLLLSAIRTRLNQEP